MNKKSLVALKKLENHINDYSVSGYEATLNSLQIISSNPIPLSSILINYYNLLLFICAYPADNTTLSLAEMELERIEKILKKSTTRRSSIFENSGLPHTYYLSCFTHDFVRWLVSLSELKVTLNSIENTKHDLNEVLKHTLPSLEKSETTAGCDNDQLFEALQVRDNNKLRFIINELNVLENTPFIKDHFYEGLGVYTDISSKNKKFSLAYNKFSKQNTYFHNEILKQFDHLKLLNLKLNKPVKLTLSEKQELIKVVKFSMAITDRETDTVTFMDEKSLRFYQLERGISVAIYSMTANRQLPLESYVGFTLFKNGFPVSYGGAWVFGGRANFGINIFEAYRGGESGYILCQVLRLFRQIFKVNYFVIEPYQFGYDNPEGIDSGAFWFYYKYGFRPVNKKLAAIAEKEVLKRTKSNRYKTSKKTLLEFTESDMALDLGSELQMGVVDISLKVKKMIVEKYGGDRIKAVKKCITFFNTNKLKIPFRSADELKVVSDMALWAVATGVKNHDKLKIMHEMVKRKPLDIYSYQNLLLKYFS